MTQFIYRISIANVPLRLTLLCLDFLRWTVRALDRRCCTFIFIFILFFLSREAQEIGKSEDKILNEYL